MISTSTADTFLLPVALRDTALTATSLAGHATSPSFEVFRQLCQEQIQRLRAELMSDGHPSDVIEDALYTQCALLDEAALSSLKEEDRDAWEHLPLQVSEFQSHDAGHELITRIERRLAQAQPVLPLLAIFQAALNLGFRGKFAFEGIDARTALMRAVDERLGRSAELGDTADTNADPVMVKRATAPRWVGQFSVLAWVVIACATAGIVYVALNQWLAASIARVAP